MADLREVRAELEAKRKEAAALERELRRAEAEPLVEVVKQAILDDDEASSVLLNMSKDEVRIVAAVLARWLPKCADKCADKINALRAKKAAKAARRKERQAGAKEPVASEDAEGEAPQTTWTDGDA